MRLDGRRNSGNVEDRRGMGGATKAVGGGIVGIIAIAVITLLSGGDLGDVISNVVGQGGLSSTSQQTEQYVEDETDRQLADLASKVLAGTEDVWTQVFREEGWGEYEAPKLVLFSGSTTSGCGTATEQVGPFYCSADQKVYIDLDFFRDMQSTIGGGGDFAYAYVIAHEVGHHVQYLLGILSQAHQQMNQVSKAQANQISVRLELQADYFAGLWANRDNKMYNSIEEGDVEEAIDVARKIGDDYLQRKAYGKEMPEAFTHGTAQQRSRWLKKGIQYGDPDLADTFTPQYSSL